MEFTNYDEDNDSSLEEVVEEEQGEVVGDDVEDLDMVADDLDPGA